MLGCDGLLVWGSVAGCALGMGSCGGGVVGWCKGRSIADSTLFLPLAVVSFALLSWCVVGGSSGHARPAIVSCSTDERTASSGVGMVQWRGSGRVARKQGGQGNLLHMGQKKVGRADADA